MFLKTNKQILLLSLLATLSLFMLFTWSCKKDDPVVLAEISTIAITDITTTTAKSGAIINRDGGGEIIARGLVWHINTGPATGQHIGITTEGTGAGMFTSNITGLSPNTLYYVKAYATNGAGTTYGNELHFTTNGMATVTTAEISSVSAISAAGGGNVTSDGNPSVTARGIVWNTAPLPNLETKLGMTNNGTGSGSFTCNITPLSPNTTYYVRAYATNNVGTSYGEEKSFETPSNDGNPCIGMPTFTDARDNNTYLTVQIGNQCWMKENLSYLPEVYAASSSSMMAPRYYVYEYEGTDVTLAKNTDNYRNYGVLYNHWAALNACPAGWHLPDISEWRQMRDYLVDEYALEFISNFENEVGTRLRSRRQVASPLGGEFATTVHPRWDFDHAYHGTDDFGFSALPGGARGAFTTTGLGLRTYWWSSTPIENSSIWSIYLASHSSAFYEDPYPTGLNGFSVRCVRD
jgi:uncharacterized protein (TIGR02145 family)